MPAAKSARKNTKPANRRSNHDAAATEQSDLPYSGRRPCTHNAIQAPLRHPLIALRFDRDRGSPTKAQELTLATAGRPHAEYDSASRTK